MSAAELSRFDELVSRYLDDTLTPANAAELVVLLAEPTLAARFLEMTRLSSEIAGLLAAPVPNAAMVELVRADIEKHLAGAQPTGGSRLQITEQTQPRAVMQPTVSTPRPIPLRRKPVFRPLAWAAVLLAFAGLAAFFLFNRRQTTDVPVIVFVQGEGRLVGPGGGRVPKLGDSWRRDEKLKTVGMSSAAAVKFHDGSQLDFGGDTAAINESSGDGHRVQLDHGTVQASLKQPPVRHPFVLATPEAEAIVVGTMFRIITGGHRTRLEVTEGEVRFRRRHDGTEVAVKAGHYAVVAPNTPFVATPFHTDPRAVH